MTRLWLSSLLLSLSFFTISPPSADAAERPTNSKDPPALERADGPLITTANRGGHAGLAKSAGDTVAIFGGPGTNEGRFEIPSGPYDHGDWTSVDETESERHWHVSTFNASLLDTTVVDNHAFWCGEEDAPGWDAPPGYGNNWDTSMVFEWPVADPSQPHEVRLRFVFHHDTEPGYDFFRVEWDSAGTTYLLDRYDDYNAEDWGDAPINPVVYDRTVNYVGGDYAGENGDLIRLVLRVTSDGAWSNEDGLWPSPFGAVQADNLQVDVDDVTVSLADAEGSPGDADWREETGPFAGDFTKIGIGLVDLDPCRSASSPVVHFIDDGLPPRNAPGESTGGSWSPIWSPEYGGMPVVNFTGGVSYGVEGVENTIISPSFPWDDPSTTADDDLDSGAFLRLDVYDHLPTLNGIFWSWAVRSRAAGDTWTPWQDHGFVYGADGRALWRTLQFDIRPLLVAEPESLQVRLGVADRAGLFFLPGDDATPAPWFQSVSVHRYQHVGPLMSVNSRNLFQDSFSHQSSVPTDGDLADDAVRLDIAHSIGLSRTIPADSMVVYVEPTAAGTDLVEPPTLRWVLEANPRYDTVRSVPAGAAVVGTNARGWDLWQGEMLGEAVVTSAGTPVEGRYSFDFPDGLPRPGVAGEAVEPGFFFPGETLRFALIAEDTGGGMSYLPESLAGLVSGEGHDPMFTVRALPTIDQTTIDTPPLLIYYDATYEDSLYRLRTFYQERREVWQRGQFWELRQALLEAGLTPGVDYDLYVGRGSVRVLSNDLGHHRGSGATLDQVAPYGTILYLAEEAQTFPGDGTDLFDASNSVVFDSTIELLDDWRDLPGERTLVYLGDRFLERGVVYGVTAPTYIQSSMGVDFLDASVLPYVDDQAAPRVTATAEGVLAGFSDGWTFAVQGGCPAPRTFSAVAAEPGAVVTHRFLATDGSPIPSVAAGVLLERQVNGDLKRDLTFPFGLCAIEDPSQPDTDPRTARAALLDEILQMVGLGGNLPVSSPSARGDFWVAHARPNPFNPHTEIAWHAPRDGRVQAEIHDLRGRRVRTLLDGPVAAGDHRLRWDGTDARGASVASGVYVLTVEGFEKIERQKLVLIE